MNITLCAMHLYNFHLSINNKFKKKDLSSDIISEVVPLHDS